ncbi:hypothetical protein [Desulfosporosinus shakirovi]|nr:hypothetical protein [Desulfosporosinus sp. SRJS8]
MNLPSVFPMGASSLRHYPSVFLLCGLLEVCNTVAWLSHNQ